MTRVLVTGANGFIGSALCRGLVAAGYSVVAATRREVPLGAGVEGRRIADVGPATDWEDALADIDAVVHLAARVHVMREKAADPLQAFRRVNTEGTRRLAAAAVAAGVKRLVYVSTVKVNGERTGQRPFRGDDQAAPKDSYARSKWEAEQALAGAARRSPLEIVILRPPLVYGPGVHANFLALMRLCDSGLPLPLGGVHNRRSLLYLGNLTDVIIGCLRSPAAAGQTYLVRDGEDVSTADLIRAIAAALGRPPRLWSVPPDWLRLFGTLTGHSAGIGGLLDSLVVDDGEIRRDLDWSPPFTMVQGLAETVGWFRSAK